MSLIDRRSAIQLLAVECEAAMEKAGIARAAGNEAAGFRWDCVAATSAGKAFRAALEGAHP
jgi:hypothetical protein